ncbi:MAG: hypothetical protein AB1782_10775 [Cyanobacteriota bacterium]
MIQIENEKLADLIQILNKRMSDLKATIYSYIGIDKPENFFEKFYLTPESFLSIIDHLERTEIRSHHITIGTVTTCNICNETNTSIIATIRHAKKTGHPGFHLHIIDLEHDDMCEHDKIPCDDDPEFLYCEICKKEYYCP